MLSGYFTIMLLELIIVGLDCLTNEGLLDCLD
jgi:hypothetical protein